MELDLLVKRKLIVISELKLLVLAGRISKLEIHPQIALMVNGMKIGKYTADFRYRENGESILEDVKSKATKTRDYIFEEKNPFYLYSSNIYTRNLIKKKFSQK